MADTIQNSEGISVNFLFFRQKKEAFAIEVEEEEERNVLKKKERKRERTIIIIYKMKMFRFIGVGIDGSHLLIRRAAEVGPGRVRQVDRWFTWLSFFLSLFSYFSLSYLFRCNRHDDGNVCVRNVHSAPRIFFFFFFYSK